MKNPEEISTSAMITGLSASFCSGVVVRTTLRALLAAAAPINPIVSFIGITALSMTVEDKVSDYVATTTQSVIDQWTNTLETLETSEDSK